MHNEKVIHHTDTQDGYSVRQVIDPIRTCPNTGVETAWDAAAADVGRCEFGDRSCGAEALVARTSCWMGEAFAWL